MTTKTNKKGFTIIEVVLVLAIAGLIFLMVFLAWPALQNSQKDTQRKNDYSQLYSQVTSYVSTLNGRIPFAGTELDAKKFMNKTGEDPDGVAYKINIKNAASDSSPVTPGISEDGTVNNVYVVFSAVCNEKNNVQKTNKKKDFVVIGSLASSPIPYCQDNNTD